MIQASISVYGEARIGSPQNQHEHSCILIVTEAAMLPTAAADMLAADLSGAESRAAAGEIEAGRRILAEGLQRAQDPRYAHEPWIPVLIRRYREAIDHYTRTHGLP